MIARKAVSRYPSRKGAGTRRGRRAGHVCKGSPGTWEILTSPSVKQAGKADRPTKPPGPEAGECAGLGERNVALRKVPWSRRITRRSGKGVRKSEQPTVPMKLGNRPGDPAEGKGCRGMDPVTGKAGGMSKLRSVSTKQDRIAKLAKEAPDMAMDLSHHMDMDWFKEAYRRTRKDSAVGVDGQTAQEYEQDLEGNLQRLINRAKSGTYRAPPVRRVYIPKGEGKERRPIGIPTLEDKVLQRAVVMALEPVYEQDFLDCSYGFRRGRSQHQALHALRQGLKRLKGGLVLDLDIRKYFDSVDHREIQRIFRQRVRDGVLRRLIGKWLNAGVMEEGRLWYPEAGVPQGGVISPLLSNIYLHEVLDMWFSEMVKPRLRGRAFMVRFADDVVMVFERQEDAERVREVLPKRLAKYGLQVHPDKTHLVRFIHPFRGGSQGKGGNSSFDFLGFTLHWGRTQRGGWAVKMRTAKGRMSRALGRVNRWLRGARHEPLVEQHKMLCKKLNGHMNYYSITGNIESVRRYIWETARRWRKWLSRRSRKQRGDWDWFNGILKRFPLPRASIHVNMQTLRSEPML